MQLFAIQGLIDITTGKSERQLRAIDKQAREVAEGASGAAGKVHLLANSLLELGKMAAVLAPLVMAAKTAARFEAEMRNVNSVLQISEPAFAKFSEAVRTASATLGTAAGPAEAAAAMYDIVSSGFTSTAKATEVLNAALISATAGLTTTKTAAAVLVGIMNTYGQATMSAAQVSDILFQTVNVGVVTFEELAQFIGPVAAIAQTAGISFQELSGAMAAMTVRGLKADIAATGLKGAISSLMAPSETAKAAMEQYGIVVNQETLAADGLVETLRKVKVATGGNAEAMQAILGDIRALTAAYSLLADDGVAAAANTEKMFASQGASARAMAEQAKSAEFQWKAFKAQIEAAAVALGSTFLPAAKNVVEAMTSMAKVFNSLPTEVTSTIGLLTSVAATGFIVKKGMTLAVGAFSIFSKAAEAAAATMSGPVAMAAKGLAGDFGFGLAPAGVKAAGTMTKLKAGLAALGLNPVTVGVLALGLAFKFYIDGMEAANAEADETLKVQSRMALGLTQNRKLWDASTEAILRYGGSLAQVDFVLGLVGARQQAEAAKAAAEEKLRYHEFASAAQKAEWEADIIAAQRLIDKNAKQIAYQRGKMAGVQKIEAAEKQAADSTTKANAAAAQASHKAWERFKSDREAGIFATKRAELDALDIVRVKLEADAGARQKLADKRIAEIRKQTETAVTEEGLTEKEKQAIREEGAAKEKAVRVESTQDWNDLAAARIKLAREVQAETMKTHQEMMESESDIARAAVTSAERVLQKRKETGAATIADEARVRDFAIAAADSELAAKTKKIDDEIKRHGGAAKLTADQTVLFANQRTAAELAHVDAVANAEARLAAARRAEKSQRLQDIADLHALNKQALDQDLALEELRKQGGAKNSAALAAARQARVQADIDAQRVATHQALENYKGEAAGRETIIRNGAAKENAIRTAAIHAQTMIEEQARQTRVAAEKQMTDDVIRILYGETVASKIEVDRQVKAWRDLGYDKVKIARWAAAQAIAAERSIADETFEIQQEMLRMQGKELEADLREVEKRKTKLLKDNVIDRVLIEAWAAAKVADIHKNAAAGKVEQPGSIGSPDVGGSTSGGGATGAGGSGGHSTSFGSMDLSGGHRMAISGGPSSLTSAAGPVDTSLWGRTPAQAAHAAQQMRSDKWAENRLNANMQGRGVESVVGLGGMPDSVQTRQAIAQTGATRVTHDVNLKINLDGSVNVQSGPLSQGTVDGITNDIGLQAHIRGDRPQGLGRTR